MNAIGKFLFWVLSPVLVVLVAAPLFVGHVAVRLLIARMRRRSHDLLSATPARQDIVRSTRPTWQSQMVTRAASRR